AAAGVAGIARARAGNRRARPVARRPARRRGLARGLRRVHAELGARGALGDAARGDAGRPGRSRDPHRWQSRSDRRRRDRAHRRGRGRARTGGRAHGGARRSREGRDVGPRRTRTLAGALHRGTYGARNPNPLSCRARAPSGAPHATGVGRTERRGVMIERSGNGSGTVAPEVDYWDTRTPLPAAFAADWNRHLAELPQSNYSLGLEVL